MAVSVVDMPVHDLDPVYMWVNRAGLDGYEEVLQIVRYVLESLEAPEPVFLSAAQIEWLVLALWRNNFLGADIALFANGDAYEFADCRLLVDQAEAVLMSLQD